MWKVKIPLLLFLRVDFHERGGGSDRDGCIMQWVDISQKRFWVRGGGWEFQSCSKMQSNRSEMTMWLYWNAVLYT